MSYSVKVRITSNGGATVYNETISQGDDTPGNVAPAYGLADPLTISQSLIGGDRGILSHPDIEEATVTLIGASSTTYADIAVGDPVAIMVYSAAGFTGATVRFCGRVGAISARPHKLGVLWTLSCVDYLADLREIPVGAGAWPAEMALARVQRITGELRVSSPGRNWTVVTSPVMAARSAGETDAYSALLDTLDSWRVGAFEDETQTAFAAGFHTQDYRPRMVQNITGADEAGLLYEPQPILLKLQAVGTTPAATRRSVYAPPARLSNLSGVRTVTVAAADSSPSTGAPTLDAARVNFDVQLTQAKGQGLANVTRATGGSGTVTFDWRTAPDWAIPASNVPWWYSGQVLALPAVTGPAIVQTIDSILDATEDPVQLLALYRSPFRPEARANWQASTLRWEAWKEPGNWRRPDLTELLTVANIQPGKLPSNREWLSGLVSGTQLAIGKGRVTFDIDLMPFSYDYDLNRFIKGATLGTVSMDSPVLSGVLLNQLATRDTLADYALVRGS